MYRHYLVEEAKAKTVYKEEKREMMKRNKQSMHLGIVVLGCDPSTREAEAGTSPSLRPAWSTKQVPAQPEHTEQSCLKKVNENQLTKYKQKIFCILIDYNISYHSHKLPPGKVAWNLSSLRLINSKKIVNLGARDPFSHCFQSINIRVLHIEERGKVVLHTHLT